MQTDLITLDGVGKTYRVSSGDVVALKPAQLTIGEGEFVAIVGPSGCGKSTLLSILGGMNSPSDGRLLVDGIDVYSLTEEKRADFRREYIGFVFQHLQLIPYLTARQNVMLPLAVTGLGRAEQTRRADAALASVGLDGKQLRLPDELSDRKSVV